MRVDLSGVDRGVYVWVVLARIIDLSYFYSPTNSNTDLDSTPPNKTTYTYTSLFFDQQIQNGLNHESINGLH